MARDNPFTKLRQNAWIIPPRRSTESLLAESGQSEWHAPYYGLSLTTEPEAMENDPDQLDVQVQEIPRPIQSHENPFTRQGRAFELPIILGRRRKARPDCLRKRIRAVYDTGSEIDAIALDLVWKHDGRMQRLHQTPLVQLANGATLPVIGLVNLWCSFAKGPRGMIKRTFNVFKEIASDVQLVMGRHFLEQTGTLTKYRSRLRECTPKLYKYPRIFSFTVPKRRFCCYLNSQLVYAVADTGSQVDLISPELANALDLDIRSVSDNERYVLLPGNIEAQVIGKTTVNFHTPNISARMLQSSPAGLPEKDHELVGRAAQGLSSPNRSKWNVKIPSIPIGDISRPWTEDVPLTPSSRSKDERRSDKTHVILSPASSQHPFYVLPSLTNNVVLGEELLDSIDAFGRFRDCFFDIKEDVAINSPDMFSIKWMKDWEKRLLGRKNQTSNWPPPYSSEGHHRPIPDMRPLEVFLQASVKKLELDSEEAFNAAISTRWCQESYRRRKMVAKIENTTERAASEANDTQKTHFFNLAQSLEQDDRKQMEQYDKDKRACVEAWKAWREWLNDRP